MRDHWTFVNGHDEYRLSLARSSAQPEAARKLSRAEAAYAIDRLLGRSSIGDGVAFALRCALEAGAYGVHAEPLEVRRVALHALQSGGLELWHARGPDLTPQNLGEADEPVRAMSRPAPRTELTWIEIELVDEAGEPVAGERYCIEFADGSAPKEGRLDARGLAYVADIPAGKCSFTFPDYDEQVWSLVASTSAPRSRTAKGP